MDFVPLTLFFMVCLQGFQENFTWIVKADKIVWPESCAGKTFCTDNSTYPDVETFKAALDLGGVDLASLVPSIDNRMGDGACKHNATHDFVYLIKDQNDVAWFVVQVPKIHEYRVQIKQCLTYDTPRGLKSDVKCFQVYNEHPFLVLSQDQLRVETVFVKGGLPVACSPKVVVKSH